MKDFFKKNKFQTYLVIVFIVGVSFIIIYCNELKIPFTNIKIEELGNKDKPFYIRNIIIALIAIATAIFTWWKNVINTKQVENIQRQTDNSLEQTKIVIKQTENIQNQIKIQEDTRLDGLYAKAVEFIKEENDLITRRGGVHILEDLAISSQQHTQKCINMLCSLNETWMQNILDRNPEYFIKSDWVNIKINYKELQNFGIYKSEFENLNEQISLSQTVIKSITSIIKHIIHKNFKYKYDLSYKYLCSINLSSFDLSNFYFKHTNLQGADLSFALLYGVDLSYAQLQGANLSYAQLLGANMSEVQLQGAHVHSAQLKGANLSYARLQGSNFSFASLKGTDLLNAQFQGAYLIKVQLQGANLSLANLEGSDLSEAKLQGTILYNVNLNGAVMFNTELKGSEIKVTKDQIILSNNEFDFSDQDFELSEEEFEKWLRNEFKYTFKKIPNYIIKQYENKMRGVYKRYNKIKKINYSEKFIIIEKPSEEFISIRNNIAIQNKSVALRMLRQVDILNEDISNISEQLRVELRKFIKVEKPDWYEEFKKEGIIED